LSLFKLVALHFLAEVPVLEVVQVPGRVLAVDHPLVVGKAHQLRVFFRIADDVEEGLFLGLVLVLEFHRLPPEVENFALVLDSVRVRYLADVAVFGVKDFLRARAWFLPI